MQNSLVSLRVERGCRASRVSGEFDSDMLSQVGSQWSSRAGAEAVPKAAVVVARCIPLARARCRAVALRALKTLAAFFFATTRSVDVVRELSAVV